MQLPVVICGKDGCGQWVARLRERESPMETGGQVAPAPDWGLRLPQTRFEQLRNFMPEMRLDSRPGSRERYARYVADGWLVGWCKRHGERWSRLEALQEALIEGRGVVTGTDNPNTGQ